MEFNSENNETPQGGNTGNSRFWGGALAGILLSLLVAVSVFVVKEIVLIYQGSEGGQEQLAGEDAPKQLVSDYTMEKLRTLEGTIQQYYYDENVDVDQMIEGMYKGLVASLGDPYSTYYTEKEYADMMDSSEGIYYGIGATVGLDKATGLARIAGVMEESPAKNGGLREGDIIYMVDNQDTQGMDLTAVVGLIKGPEGTFVELKIYREGETDYLDFKLERKKIENPTVKYEMLDGNIGYLQITEFDTITYGQFMEGLTALEGSGMKGMILDLRSNPGGNLTTVVDISRQLLPKGLIVYTEDRDKNRNTYSSEGSNVFELPLVVLINGYSASASEILAGAIKDYGMGELIGTTTYGKGIVQSLMPLSDGTAVKLTVSSYFTPKGNNIHGVGIEPDIVCEFDADQYYDNEIDNQLNKAKEVITEKIKSSGQ